MTANTPPKDLFMSPSTDVPGDLFVGDTKPDDLFAPVADDDNVTMYDKAKNALSGTWEGIKDTTFKVGRDVLQGVEKEGVAGEVADLSYSAVKKGTAAVSTLVPDTMSLFRSANDSLYEGGIKEAEKSGNEKLKNRILKAQEADKAVFDKIHQVSEDTSTFVKNLFDLGYSNVTGELPRKLGEGEEIASSMAAIGGKVGSAEAAGAKAAIKIGAGSPSKLTVMKEVLPRAFVAETAATGKDTYQGSLTTGTEYTPEGRFAAAIEGRIFDIGVAGAVKLSDPVAKGAGKVLDDMGEVSGTAIPGKKGWVDLGDQSINKKDALKADAEFAAKVTDKFKDMIMATDQQKTAAETLFTTLKSKGTPDSQVYAKVLADTGMVKASNDEWVLGAKSKGHIRAGFSDAVKASALIENLALMRRNTYRKFGLVPQTNYDHIALDAHKVTQFISQNNNYVSSWLGGESMSHRVLGVGADMDIRIREDVKPLATMWRDAMKGINELNKIDDIGVDPKNAPSEFANALNIRDDFNNVKSQVEVDIDGIDPKVQKDIMNLLEYSPPVGGKDHSRAMAMGIRRQLTPEQRTDDVLRAISNAQNYKPVLDIDSVNRIIDTYSNQEWGKVFMNDIKNLSRGIREELLASGVISTREFDDLSRTHPYYSPSSKILGENPFTKESTRATVKTLSKRDNFSLVNEDPLGAWQSGIVNTGYRVMTNARNKAVLDFASNMPDELFNVFFFEDKKQVEKAVIAARNMGQVTGSPSRMPTINHPEWGAAGVPNYRTIDVMINGEKITLTPRHDGLRQMLEMTPYSNKQPAMTRLINNVFRATTFTNVNWAVRQAIKDSADSVLVSDKGVAKSIVQEFPKTVAQSIGEVFSTFASKVSKAPVGSPESIAFRELNPLQTNERFSNISKFTAKELDDMKEKILKSSTATTAFGTMMKEGSTSSLHLFKEFVQSFDSATRSVKYKEALKQGLTEGQAMAVATDVGVNFFNRGVTEGHMYIGLGQLKAKVPIQSVSWFPRMIPITQSIVGGLDYMTRAARYNTKRTAQVATGYTVLAAAAKVYGASGDESTSDKMYRQNIGDVELPTFGNLFGGIANAGGELALSAGESFIDNYYPFLYNRLNELGMDGDRVKKVLENSPQTKGDVTRLLVDTSLNYLPTTMPAWGSWVNLLRGKDSFGRDLAQYPKHGKQPEWVIKLGEESGIDAITLHQALKNIGGDYYTVTSDLIDKTAGDAMGWPTKPKRDLSEQPFIGRFIKDKNPYTENTRVFRNLSSDIATVKDRAAKLQRSGAQEALSEYMDQHDGLVSLGDSVEEINNISKDIRAQIQDIYKDNTYSRVDKKERIDNLLRQERQTIDSFMEKLKATPAYSDILERARGEDSTFSFFGSTHLVETPEQSDAKPTKVKNVFKEWGDKDFDTLWTKHKKEVLGPSEFSIDAPDKVKSDILRAAGESGVDSKTLLQFAWIESKLNPDASNGNAKGLFQFMPDTWADSTQRWGDKYILDESGIDSSYNQALMTAELLKENTHALELMDIPATPVNLYFMHFLGSTGGAVFLHNYYIDPNSDIRESVSEAAINNNQSLFRDVSTAGDLYKIYDKKFNDITGVASGVSEDAE